MNELLTWLRGAIPDRPVQYLLPVLGLLVGSLWGRWRAWRRWTRRDFLDRINLSLNTIVDGRLLIRTLQESSLLEVFLNPAAVELVRKAAAKTTEKDPLLPLAKGDAWFLLNAVLNELSERFAVAQLRRDQGQAVTMTRYLIALTRERSGEVRTQKVRAMIVQKALLENLPAERPQLEQANHSVRWETLRAMARVHREAPERLLEVEIGA